MGGGGVGVQADAFAVRSIALRHFMGAREPSPLYTSGADGSRFRRHGQPYPCLYAALDAETAHREGNQPFYAALARGVSVDRLKPPEEVVMIGVRFKLGRMLDVRDREIQARLDTSDAELASPWKLAADAPTQRLGDAVHASEDFEGIIYSSVRNPGGTCFVVFPDRLADGSLIEYRSRTAGVPDVRLGPH